MPVLTVTRNQLQLLRVVPHRSVLNSSNRKLWRTLHDLLAVDDPLARRLRRLEGWRWEYRHRDRVYWIVTMRADAGPDGPVRRVQFNVLLPEPCAEVFLVKLRNHEQWSRCTVQEVEPEALQLPDDDAYSLKLSRHDIFSLHVDYSRQTTPIRDLLLVTGELQPGDSAALVVSLEAVGRRRWQAVAEYAWDVWHAGQVPQRRQLDSAQLWRLLWRGGAALAAEARALADDLLDAVEGAFFAGSAGEKRERSARAAGHLPDPERQALLVNGSLSRETQGKRNLPVFRADLLVLVSAGTEARRRMLAHSMAAAFGELAGDNQLRLVQVPLRWEEIGPHRLPAVMDMDPNLLSTDEVGRIVQLPTAEVQEEFREVLVANRAVEVVVPRPFMGPGIYAGDATLQGATQPVYVPTDNLDMLMTPRVLIGSPRMGKDTAAVNWIVEAALRHGHGAVVLDVIDERNGHRGMADALRDHLPPERVIDLNLGDFEYPIPITLDGVTATKDARIAADRLAKELVTFLLGDAGAEQHQTREYLRAAAKAVAGDLLGIKLVLTNAAYRKGRIADLRRRGWDTTLLEEFDRMSEGRQGQVAGPVLVRLGEILEDEALRPMFCQRSRPETSLRRWMEDGRVVIYRVPARDLSESSVRVLAHWLVMTVFLTKLAMGGAGAPTWFVLNEPHQYLSPGFIHFSARMLAEGPKYRLAPIFLLHNLKQLPADFVEILMSASLNWHVFKNTNAYVYERLGEYLRPTFDPPTLAMEATKRFHYVAVWLDQEGEYQPPFVVRAPAPVWERYPTRQNEWLTRRHSRQFGRPYAEVEAEIRGRMQAGA